MLERSCSFTGLTLNEGQGARGCFGAMGYDVNVERALQSLSAEACQLSPSVLYILCNGLTVRTAGACDPHHNVIDVLFPLQIFQEGVKSTV